MDKKFDNFLDTKGLGVNTKKQYTLYFDKAELLYNNNLFNQDMVNEFISTYKSNLVRSFLKVYFEFKGIKDLIVNKRTGRPTRKKPVIMSKEDAELLLSSLYQYNEKYGLMTELSYCCALRRDEVCNIGIGDIDWDEWKQEKKTGKLLITKAKGDKQRYVIIPKQLMEKLGRYINKNHFMPSNKLFFKNSNDKNIPISKERYWEVYHKFVVGLFNKKYKLHTLRSTKATQWFEDGIDIVRIQQRLGHSNIETTRLYIDPDNKKELDKWREE
jgi:integrase/recombinase XerD